MSVKRSKNFTTLCYQESTEYGVMLESLNSLHVSYLISPLHHLDRTREGDFKKPHYHIVIIFDSLKSVPQVKDVLSSCAADFVGCEIVNSLQSYARYLCHLDNPDKAKYDVKDVISYSINYEALIQDKGDKYAAFSRLVDYVVTNDITSFSSLLLYAKDNDVDMFHALVDNSYTAREFIKSYSMDRRNLKSGSNVSCETHE